MSVTRGGTAPNPCRRGGSWSLDAGSAGIVAVFSMWNLPPSRHQVQIEPSRFVVSTTMPRNSYSRTGSCAGRTSSAIWWLAPRSIVWTLRRARRSQKWIRWPYLFESKSSGTIPFSNCGRQPPFTCYHVVARQVPPEIVVQVLGSAINLPTAKDVKRLAVHNEHARWPIGAIFTAATERADVDAFRTAMNSVGPRVAGLLEHLVGLDDLVDACLGGIGLRIHDINPRGAEPGDDQVAPLEEGVASEGRQCRRARVPTKMVELVARV